MPILERAENKVPYETWGESGSWVTLVNGYTRTMTDFKSMGRFLSEKGWRVLAFDNRGAGKAECNPVFTFEELVDDIVALWDHLKIEKSHLLGISFGAAISANTAATHPARVKSLALVSAPLTKGSLSTETKGPSRDPRRLERDLLRYFSPKFLAENKMLVQGFIRQMGRTFQDPDTGLGALAQRGAMENLDLRVVLPNVSVPTIVIHGEADMIIPFETAKETVKLLPKGKLHSFPEVGHLLLAEIPKTFYETAEAFFRSQE